MPFYQWDASGLIKRYVDERGSDWVQAALAPAAGNIAAIAEVTRVEVASALARRVREGFILKVEGPDLAPEEDKEDRCGCLTHLRTRTIQRCTMQLLPRRTVRQIRRNLAHLAGHTEFDPLELDQDTLNQMVADGTWHLVYRRICLPRTESASGKEARGNAL
jgi:hypothetical protein